MGAGQTVHGLPVAHLVSLLAAPPQDCADLAAEVRPEVSLEQSAQQARRQRRRHPLSLGGTGRMTRRGRAPR